MRKKIIAADLFAGVGGTSTGLIRAVEKMGFDVDLLAVNHWDKAIETHELNHPGARHLNEDLDLVNPREVVPGKYLDLLVASPECTHHSKARGGKPVDDQSRASAWTVLRWAEALYIENILIENVPDFQTWGPLDKNKRPIKRLKGQTYLAFLDALRSLGYDVDARVLNCANYGDPTTRQRLFILARRDKKVCWPEPTHSKDGEFGFLAKTKKWVPAKAIIDWSIKGNSIFTRKKPLKETTMRRIMKGLEKYSGLPFVLGQQSCAAPRDVAEPLPTIAGAGAISLIEPFLIKFYRTCNAASINEPLPTVTAKGGHLGLVEPYMISFYGQSNAQSIHEPMPTITAKGEHIGLVQPFFIQYHGTSHPGGERVRSIDDPFPTIATENQLALCEPFIVAVNHGKDDTRSYPITKPLPTITGLDAWGVVEPFLINYNGKGTAHSLDEPVPTVTGNDRFGLVLPLQDGSQAVLDILFRMLQPHELAAAMSFPKDYQFVGNRRERVKQIGNAVPGRTAEALIMALLN
jgi:DNA (cytosine-5)-methyltransferase 1